MLAIRVNAGIELRLGERMFIDERGASHMDYSTLARIAAVIQSSPVQGWLVIDRDFNVAHANDAYCQLWKVKAQEVIGKYILDLFYHGRKKDKRGRYVEPLIETMDTGHEIALMEVCVSNVYHETNIWCLANTYLLRDDRGDIEYAVGTYLPIDKFKVIERRLDSINLDIIKAFCKAIGVRDAYTKQHSESVAYLMVELAEFMNLSPEEVTKAYLAGIVHDVGKIGVPEKVLAKPGRLSEEEFKVIKCHPVKGAEILAEIDGLGAITRVVRHHHERYDGRGYPEGVAGEDIPFLSRMLSICDAYDAMTSKRCYRDPYTAAQALNEIKRCAGQQFDPVISGNFIQLMKYQHQR
ncbi:PAS domain S-box-containing protein [Dendrosporobacter quercicolus]|uniref:PAS domain S-box-containing protein n=1 Tax=Dendrosporobacter quercicolus TaxID=146817 RepID=A0A1G9QDQ1_9FIRM|nr:HD domain-containing phosphohydrolase [Dendrosporobacter quercicolus]SDM08455.1 PAS domain S-box-containing protein [Dendrosporobacter quercicolus]